MKHIKFTLLSLLALPLIINATEKLTKLELNRIQINKTYLDAVNKTANYNVSGTPTFATVGGDAACDYQIGADTLQDAVDSGLPEIRLATNTTYSKVSIFSSISILGGYNNCTEATNNTISQNASNSIINGDPILATFNINTANITITMKNLTIQNGKIGISKFGINTSLIIQDSIIQNNTNPNNESAGIYMASAGSGSTFLENVRVTNNSNDGSGGGIYCVNNETLTIVGDSSIDNNHTNFGGGGGIFADTCDITIVGGSNLTFPVGISNNTTLASSSDGGGIYAGSSTVTITGAKMVIDGIEYGDLTTPYVIYNNITSPAQTRSGGGIYVSNSTLNLTNISMTNNASNAGGAIAAVNNSQVTIDRSAQACWSDISCNIFQGNTAKSVAGAIHFSSGADGIISASTFTQNRADVATVLNAGSNNTVVELYSSFIYNNGNNGIGGFNDSATIRANNGANILFYHNTMVNNHSTNTINYILNNSGISFYNSIIYNPAINAPFVTVATGGYTAICNFVDDTNNNSSGQVYTISQFDFDTSFVDAANSNYHINQYSIFIDQCSVLVPNLEKDIDGQLFGEDIAMVNGSGSFVYDAGADEYSEFVFKNGFE